MPESIDNWNVPKDIHEEYLWRIGNLTLLGAEYNRTVSNKTFKEKKKVYVKSNILITKEILKYNAWGKNEIENRQKILAEQALKVWNISD